MYFIRLTTYPQFPTEREERSAAVIRLYSTSIQPQSWVKVLRIEAGATALAGYTKFERKVRLKRISVSIDWNVYLILCTRLEERFQVQLFLTVRSYLQGDPCPGRLSSYEGSVSLPPYYEFKRFIPRWNAEKERADDCRTTRQVEDLDFPSGSFTSESFDLR